MGKRPKKDLDHDTNNKSAIPRLMLATSTESYFFESVQKAKQETGIALTPDAEFYLVNLLNRFTLADQYHPQSATGERETPALALMMKDALDEPNPSHRRTLFQHVGDVSLYRAGFFLEHLTQSGIDPGYVMSMGGTAYYHAARVSQESAHQELFEKLHHSFERCVDLIAVVAEDATPSTTSLDIFKLCEIYENTGSPRAKRLLTRAGIPLPAVKRGS